MDKRMNNQKTSAERTIVSGVLTDGRLVELVFDPDAKRTMLAVGRGDAVSVVPHIEDGAIRLVPVGAQNNLIKHRALLLAERPEFQGDAPGLMAEIETYLGKYVDLSEQFQKIVAAYVLLTWVYDAFNELPYLRFRGDFGSGKTRALLVIGSICHKAFFASGASTVSPIFHALDTFRGTLIFDEADFRFSDEKSELVKIFNNGNARGFPVLRSAITPRREFDPRAFHVFGPKIVAMRRSFEDQALESRFLTEQMGERALSEDIPINLPAAQEDDAARLRNRLLGYRFMSFHRIHLNDGLVDTSLSPRLNQILVPLLSIIDDEELREAMRDSMRPFDDAIAAERAASPEACVLEILAELFHNMNSPSIPFSEVVAAFSERYGDDFDRPITKYPPAKPGGLVW